MIGLTAATWTPRARAAAIEARMPGTRRIGPTDTSGLDGHRMMAAAPSNAASTSGVGAAVSIPANRSSSTSGAWRWCTKYSWNSSHPSAVRTSVATDRSVIGRMRPAIPREACAARHASVTRAPARTDAVRAMCSARSRSPSENQVSSPYVPSCSMTMWVSPSIPQPQATCSIPARL